MFEDTKESISRGETVHVTSPSHVAECCEGSVDKLWVDYPAATEILGRMAGLQADSSANRAQGLLIVGEAGNGKTSILRRFLDLNPPNHDLEHGVVIPGFFLMTPPVPTEQRFFEVIHESLFVPIYASFRSKRKDVDDIRRCAMADILKHIGLRTLLIDDLHDVVASRHDKLADLFKMLELFFERGITVVATADASEADHLLRLAPIRRLFETARLPRWKMDSAYIDFLGRWERVMATHRPSTLNLAAAPAVAEAILKRTDGSLGRIVSLAEAVTSHVAATGREAIDREMVDAMPRVVAECSDGVM